ncbi:glycosyltransferase family 2 protein [Demequina sp. NBRC 110051]|uniref:glycosyltransferase family 2 protein n=1 Tax=Demequina sp. NBRC 110051 TaxID=1570340 RepID=UPI0013563CAC|nr:glycosyltransferase family 2 protein [Demequina sp. NBRC 110051]
MSQRDLDDGLTVCICTRNRPDELAKALESLHSGTRTPDQVIVSDDGVGAGDLSRLFPGVEFYEGPKRGLGPNRNACLSRARFSRVAFIDDDVVVAKDFVERAYRCPDDRVTTGWELNFSSDPPRRVESSNATFLGHQARAVTIQPRVSIVINATVFPASLFSTARFNEHVRYGYEELDMARQAVVGGFQIAFDPELWVEHYPSLNSRDDYLAQLETSRIYLTHRAYAVYEHRPVKGMFYVASASVHAVAVGLKRQNLAATWRAVADAIRLIRRDRHDTAAPPR